LTIYFYYDYLYTKLFKANGSGTVLVDLISPPPAITSGYAIEKGGFNEQNSTGTLRGKGKTSSRCNRIEKT
jgi:hypothetical protein